MHGGERRGRQEKIEFQYSTVLEGKLLQEWKDFSRCLFLGYGPCSENKHAHTLTCLGISFLTQS